MEFDINQLTCDDYLSAMSQAFENLDYEVIQFARDNNARLLIPTLSFGVNVSKEGALRVMHGLFNTMDDYGCNVEQRVIAAWTNTLGEGIPFDSEESARFFASCYDERTRVINGIKASKGIQVTDDPYWGILVFSHSTPILFHCQLPPSIDFDDTESLCLSLCQEQRALATYNRYPLAYSVDSLDGVKKFDWSLFHSLWWNDEDNAFIRYSLNELSEKSDSKIKDALSNMQEAYAKKMVQEYNDQQQLVSCLMPDMKRGVMTEEIARYDWITHTKMLMDLYYDVFVQKRNPKERVPDEERCYSIIQNYCKRVKPSAESVRPQYKGYGWTEESLMRLWKMLIDNGHISPNVPYDNFRYYFGGHFDKNSPCKALDKIDWVGTQGGMIVAFIEAMHNCEYPSKKNKGLTDWNKVNEVLYAPNFTLTSHGKPNVKRKNKEYIDGTYKKTPYEVAIDDIEKCMNESIFD